MKKKYTHAVPRWPLSDEWAVGLDACNWRLYQRIHSKKDDKPTGWRVVGYYPNLGMLLESLANKVAMNDTGNPTLKGHLLEATETWEALQKVFVAKMLVAGVGLGTKPPRYADFSSIDSSSKE